MTQAALVETVRAELSRLGHGEGIEVRSVGGVVTLTGRVADARTRQVLAQEILRLPQVLDLRNELQVEPPPGDVVAQLRALLARDGVAAERIAIGEADGVVTLSGEAEGWFDRDAAERLAWTLAGVRAVVNEIRIPPGAADPELSEREG